MKVSNCTYTTFPLLCKDCHKKEKIEQHIRKIEGYNARHVYTTFVLIYSDTDSPIELWDKYMNSLAEIEYSGMWKMEALVKKENIEKEILNNDLLKSDSRYVCMTRHKCDATGDEIHKYHILLD